MSLIDERVRLARLGQNPFAITQMPSGWLVIGDVQPLPGYCLLLADPVVPSINDLTNEARIQYSLDVIRIGDALLAATGAYRINYETLGNSEPALHTHIVPRYMSEPEAKRRQPAFMSYDWSASRKYTPELDSPLVTKLRALLAV
ncbi:MAG: HIT domain-containing protein [Alphaproteobacteria bacterium]